MKGLSFSEPMVKAWLAGNKSVTRRLMNPQPVEFSQDGSPRKLDRYGKVVYYSPRYHSGEMVYIKEVWHCDNPATAQDAMSRDEGLYYKAGMAEQEASMFKWKSPRFMPEWATRSHALIVSVRIERVQEITNEEAIKEGAIFHNFGKNRWGNQNPGWKMFPIESLDKGLGTARFAFANLWESLHPGSWERNDWVWRIELEKRP